MNRRQASWMLLAATGIVVGVSGCDQSSVQPLAGRSDASVSAVVTMDNPVETRAFVDRVRARFQPGDSVAQHPLPLSTVDEVRLDNGWVVAHFPEDGARRPADVLLPTKMTDAFRLTDLDSGLAAEIKIAGAHPSAAETAHGYVVYRAAVDNADVLHRVTPSGTEATLHFPAQPEAPYFELALQLGERVAGVRLVGHDTVELLDKSGAPRVRLAAPTVTDANGQKHATVVSVDGCSLSPAGGVVDPGIRRCTIGVGWEKATGVVYPALVQAPWTIVAPAPLNSPVGQGGAGKVPVPQPNAGMTCMNAGQCASGFCINGYCCNSLCNGGGCQRCDVAGVEGTCTTVPNGQPGGCSPYNCKGQLVCPTSCAVDADCSTGNYCNAGFCSSKIATGSGCSAANQCLSGYCADSVCCSAACTGGCDVCTLALGATANGNCTVLPAGNTGVNPSCSPYVCNGVSAACPNSCLSDANCTASYYCGNTPYFEDWESGQARWFTSGNFAMSTNYAHSVTHSFSSTCYGGYVQYGTSSNLTGAVNPSVSWWDYRYLYYYDATYLEVSTDNVNWTSMWSNTNLYTQTWTQHTVSLNAYVGSIVYIRFREYPYAGSASYCLNNGYSGWYIDDISLPGSNTCAQKLAAGTACGAANQCSSGFCVDGYCCNAACTGGCDRCNLAGNLGTCTVVPANPNDPGANPSCSGYSCNGLVGICPTTCSSDANCANAYFCTANACVAKYVNGTSCTAANQCSSGFCNDGFCCNAACSGGCDVCSQALGASANGTCTNLAAGATGMPTCSPYVCTGAAGACPTSCTLDTNCSNGNYCNTVNSQCSASLAQGQACTRARQCTSNSCVDGFCCDTLCNGGACQHCSLATGSTANGTCRIIAQGQVGSPSCGLYVCNGTAATCPATCISDTDCAAAAAYCNGGNCVAKKANGTGCTAADQCTSNYCVDGVCCNAACGGACDFCNLAGSIGTCTVSPVGGVGSPSCSPFACDGTNATCPASCTADAQCAATYYCSGAQCVSKLATGVACTAGNQCTSTFCSDGYCCNAACTGGCDVCSAALGASANGTCTLLPVNNAGQNPACLPYVCSGTVGTCPASCGSDANCNSSYYCGAQQVFENFESGSPNWTSSGNWGLSTNYSHSATHSASSTCYGGTWTYNRTINLVGAVNPTLVWWDYRYLYYYDAAYVEVSTDNVSWTTIWTLTNLYTQGWTQESVSLNAYVGRNIYLRFREYPYAGSASYCLNNGYSGWYVDDITIPNNPTCIAKQSNGSACTAANQCTSSFCVDGYCCNAACAAGCDRCNIAGSLGTCTVVAANPPDPGANPSCNGYVCGGLVAQCPTVCATDANCTTNYYCAANACVAKAINGTACTAANQCSSGFCNDGFCCNAACTGGCDVCAQALGASANGTCTYLAAGANGMPSCSPYVCSGAASACPMTCASDANCATGYYCGVNSQCVASLANASACTRGRQCTSSNCVDGVCCNTACSGGGCQHCSLALGASADGTCTIVAQGNAGSPACAPYVCNGTLATCPGTCMSDMDCANTAYCSGGNCVTKKTNGNGCTAAGQCQSGFCVDGYCCNGACAGACDACNLAGTLGTCTVLAVGGVGAPSCSPYACDGAAATCPTACNTNAQCANGYYCSNSACLLKKTLGTACTAGGQCASGFCADSVCCNAACTDGCDACSRITGASADGTCTVLPAANAGHPGCGNYVCNGQSNACPTTCSVDATCAIGYFCGSQSSFFENWESGTTNWNTAGGNWALSTNYSYSTSHSLSSSCYGGSVVFSQTLNLSGVASAFITWYDYRYLYYYDVASVDVSTDGGVNWTSVWSLTNLYSQGWTYESVSLGAYLGRTVQIRFREAPYAGSASYCLNNGYSGWYIDNITLPNSAACVAKKANGATCTGANQCTSGSCVDGYCCNGACAGGCDRCNVAGSLGTCSVVPAADPGANPSCGNYVCDGQAASCPTTCQSDANCGSAYYCAAGMCIGKNPTGTACTANDQCTSAFCTDGYCCTAACNGSCNACSVAKGAMANGSCRILAAGTLGTPSCSPFVCDGNSGVCPASCTADANCATGYYCNGGTCAAQLGLGLACSRNGACRSNFCIDGVCCNNGCFNGCDFCNLAGSVGTCTVAAQGNVGSNPSCAPYVCNGSSASCPSSCVLNSDCATNYYCNAGTCTAQGNPGASCSLAIQCKTGFCVDGFCCTTLCAGGCDACNIPGFQGTCSVLSKGALGTNPSCAPYACDGTRGACPTSCTTVADCVNGGQPGVTCIAGVCSGLKGNGQACTMGAECTSGNCAQGYCCNTVCNGGACQRCDVAGSLGACTILPAGNAGTPSCGAYVCNGSNTTCPAACATDANCATGYFCSAGACTAKQANGSACTGANQCTSAFCVDGYCCNSQCALACDSCNVAGSLGTCSTTPAGAVGSPSCSPYLCGGVSTSCPTTCSADANCVNGYTCNMGICITKQVNGTACTIAAQCTSTFCVDGFCCNAACSGGCDVCAASLGASANGTCTNLPANNPGQNPSCSPFLCSGAAGACPTTCTVDANCTMGYACVGGTCVAKVGNGTVCTANNQCTSGFCAQGYCCNTACNGGGCQRCDQAGAQGTCTVLPVGNGGNPSCGTYVCNGTTASCPTSCTVDANCVMGDFCMGGVCVGKSSNGTTCTAASQCVSNFCVDGVCCNTACAGGCDACNIAGRLGSCSVVALGNPGTSPSCAPYLCDGMNAPCPGTCTMDASCAGGYYCSGGVCTVKSTNGTACAAANQCVSGNCVDGVCCNAVCGGACDVCSQALGASANGTCTLLAAGQAGSPSCSPYVCGGAAAACPASCTVDANCSNGYTCVGGACIIKKGLGGTCTAANQCLSGFCADGVCCDQACTGACQVCAQAHGAPSDGTCTTAAKAYNVAACNGFLCDGTNTGCPTVCAADADCRAGYTCSGNTCRPKAANGTACATGNDCQSTFCADGFCCNSACSGACDACSVALGASANGTCTNLPAGNVGSPACAPYLCSGANGACPASCTLDAQCIAGDFCSSGACTAKNVNGTACTGANQCASGFCVNGVCCNSACNAGGCQRCDTAGSVGTCSLLAQGNGGNPSCGTYLCDGTNGGCPGTCARDADCAAGNYCGANRCTGKLALGVACTTANQCASGNCVDGVCCNTLCNGGCDACNVAGALGTCTVVAAGNAGSSPGCAPYVCNGISANCPNTCVTNANCAANSNCQGNVCVGKAGNGQACAQGTQCVSGFCVSGVCCNSSCAGACQACTVAGGAAVDGTCAVLAAGNAGSPSCGAYYCNGALASCPTSCVVDANCSAGNFCRNAACVARLTNGTVCTAATQCQSGFCANGYCCNTACSGNCNRCDINGSQGTCGVAAAGQLGAPSCSPYRCDGMNAACPNTCAIDTDCAPANWCNNGACTPKQTNGSNCGAGNQCSSGFCVNGVCCNSACSGSCDRCDNAGFVGTCKVAAVGYPGANPSCAPYLCDGVGDTCPMFCAADANCIAGFACVAGKCTAKQSNGSTCTQNGQCTSGFCVQGYCCNSTCVGGCNRCDVMNVQGTCTPLTAGAAGAQCGLYLCNGVQGACPGTCMSDANCTMGSYCDATNHCIGKLPQGATCGMGTQCISGFCSDGYCCNTACAGACDRCDIAGKTGTCAPVAAGNPGSPACGVYVCDGASGACPTSCTADQNCVAGDYCLAGKCMPQQMNGNPCILGNQCASGNCVGSVNGMNGVCCNTTCTGTCARCDIAGSAGTCTALKAGNAGNAPGCMPFACDGTNFSCPTMCTKDTDCASGGFCDNGRCASQLANGQACTKGGHQCQNGNCVDGYCCDTVCTGQCAACNVAGKQGTCTSVVGQPQNGRQACGGTGTCAGTCDGTTADTCTFPDVKVTCAVAVCRAGTATSAASCDGKGACTPGTRTDCGGAGCNVNGTACNQAAGDGGTMPGGADMTPGDTEGGYTPGGCNSCDIGGHGSSNTNATLVLVLFGVAIFVSRRRRR